MRHMDFLCTIHGSLRSDAKLILSLRVGLESNGLEQFLRALLVKHTCVLHVALLVSCCCLLKNAKCQAMCVVSSRALGGWC